MTTQVNNMDTDFRPKIFDQVIGQEEIKENLRLKIAAFRKTKKSVVHMLFLGFSGAGKTTLANVVANEMGVTFHQVMATRIKNWNDFYAILRNVEENDVLFIDEIHALSSDVQENLYGVMEDFKCTIEDKNLQRQRIINLPKFTLIGATTHTGDLAELPGLDERSALIPWITSNRENCLGSQCPAFKNCHVNNARRDALAADIVVINHHLFFADLAVRESGMAELLPSVRVVVFDEAHQLNETGVNFLGQQLSTSQLLDLTRDLLATGLQLARGFADWQGLASALEFSARDLRLLVGQRNASTKIKWTEPTPEGIAADAWQHALEGVYQAADNIAQSLETVVEVAPDFLRLQERMVDVMQRVSLFAKACDSQTVRWLDVTASQMRLMQAPLDIADTVRERLLKQSAPKSWIFTSATLGDEPTLRWFTEPCGLESAQVLRVESPFDYPNQASMFVPKDIVRPNDPAHSAQVARLASVAVRVLGGKTLVLTTTLRALRAIGDAMKQQLEGSGIEVLMQGEWPKRELMARFQDATPEQGGCVLVASATFWEGFDVPGDALQLVIIDKLPFPPPNDPIVEARGKRLETQGRSPFNDFFVPEAVIALKQGAGRLIRRETDRGVLVVCDNRLATTGYGKRLLAAMPNMRQLHTQEELHEALQAL